MCVFYVYVNITHVYTYSTAVMHEYAYICLYVCMYVCMYTSCMYYLPIYIYIDCIIEIFKMIKCLFIQDVWTLWGLPGARAPFEGIAPSFQSI